MTESALRKQRCHKLVTLGRDECDIYQDSMHVKPAQGVLSDSATSSTPVRRRSLSSSSSNSSSSDSGTSTSSSSTSSSSNKSDQQKECNKNQPDDSTFPFKSERKLSSPVNKISDSDKMENISMHLLMKNTVNVDKSVCMSISNEEQQTMVTHKVLSDNVNKNIAKKTNDEGSIKRNTLNYILPYSDSSTEYDDESIQILKTINAPDKENKDIDENAPACERDLGTSSRASATRKFNIIPNYRISPVYTDESDVDLSDDDPDYTHTANNLNQKKQRNFFFTSDSLSSGSSDSSSKQIKKGRKRLKNTTNWKQNTAKRLRNSGKSYISISKEAKKIRSRHMKVPCKENCKLKCSEKINTDNRYKLFTSYWGLADLYKQRAYIKSSMVDIKPRYKYTNAENPRKPNKAYYFTVENDKIRVCKTFFKNTLDVSDRMIFTTQQKTNSNDFLEHDLRGKHSNHKKMNPELIKDITNHINSIPRMEAHYVRATTSREYIDGGKTIKDLFNDFVQEQKQNNRDIGNYMAYYNIFTKDFNISFFQPKKDMCDLCLAYDNSTADQKKELTENYNQHQKEKKLSREEKRTDRNNINNCNKVAIYDLQAVLQCPRGESSSFYYKSKLNCYNLTITELMKSDINKKKSYNQVHSYFWTESDAKRGAIEIGTCIWKYLEEVSKDAEEPLNIIFYSDNCTGQNKNKYIMSMYMYAVHLLNIQSITHKFLIRGHTQNEADNVHGLIEKEVKKNLKSGPIYTPIQYITLIKNSKKSNPPINVHEIAFDSILDWKNLQEEWGYNFSTDESDQKINWNDIKVLKVTKENPFLFYFKTSYQEEIYKEVNVRNKRKKLKPATEISLNKAYTERQEITSNKKKDLKELIVKGLIPSYYASFYNSIL